MKIKEEKLRKNLEYLFRGYEEVEKVCEDSDKRFYLGIIWNRLKEYETEGYNVEDFQKKYYTEVNKLERNWE